jgi:hypothetical protein
MKGLDKLAFEYGYAGWDILLNSISDNGITKDYLINIFKEYANLKLEEYKEMQKPNIQKVEYRCPDFDTDNWLGI